jgi:hypothetical protein
VPLRWALVRDPYGAFDMQTLFCAESAATPEQVLAWSFRRWQLVVTCEGVRRDRGVETQRQWSELAIRRSTPAFRGLYSLVTPYARRRLTVPTASSRQSVWYHNARPTSVDALALLRRELSAHRAFSLSASGPGESPAKAHGALSRDTLRRRVKGQSRATRLLRQLGGT